MDSRRLYCLDTTAHIGCSHCQKTTLFVNGQPKIILSEHYSPYRLFTLPNHNPATRFRPPSATVVSAEPFSHGTGTLWCLQKEMATYRHWSVSLWRDPDDVSHCRILSRQNWMAAYLGYTQRMRTLFRGWPIMVNDTHTRRRLPKCRLFLNGQPKTILSEHNNPHRLFT